MKVSETPKTFFFWRFFSPLPQSSSYKRGALGFFILRIWPSFWFGFSVFTPKSCGFSLLVPCAVCAFLQFSHWFSVFANSDDGFSVILFSLSSRAKTVIPRDLYSLLPRLSFRGIHDKPSLLSSRYLNRDSYQAGYKKVNIKAKYFSQISSSWDNILWILTLDCAPTSFCSSNASFSSCRPVNNVALMHSLCSHGIKAKTAKERLCLVLKKVI